MGGPITTADRTKASSFPLYTAPHPLPKVSVETVFCHWIWRTCGCLPLHNQQQESFCSVFPPSWPWEKKEMPMLPSQVLPTQRNRAVPGDHALGVTGSNSLNPESDWGFRQPSTWSQNIKNRRCILVFLLPSQPCCKPRRAITETSLTDARRPCSLYKH